VTFICTIIRTISITAVNTPHAHRGRVVLDGGGGRDAQFARICIATMFPHPTLPRTPPPMWNCSVVVVAAVVIGMMMRDGL
jgi:hypothetical protein